MPESTDPPAPRPWQNQDKCKEHVILHDNTAHPLNKFEMRCTKQQVEMFNFISIVTICSIFVDPLGVLVVNWVNMGHHTVLTLAQFHGSRRSSRDSIGWTALSGTAKFERIIPGMVRDRKYTPLVAGSLLNEVRNTAWFHVHVRQLNTLF